MDAYKPQVLKELYVDTSSKTVLDFRDYLLSGRKKNGEKFVESTIERYVTFIKRYEKIFISSKLTTTQLNDLMKRVNGSVLYATIILWLRFHGYDKVRDTTLFSSFSKPPRYANFVTSERFLRSKVLSRNELRLIIDKETDPLYKELYMFAYDTAMRRAELFKANWKHVNVFNSSRVNDKKFTDVGIAAQIRILGKGRKWRTVYIYRATFDLMRKRITDDLIKEKKGDILLYKLYQKDGKHLYKNQEHAFYKYLVKHATPLIDRQVHPHCFRHTQATHLADAGCSVMKILKYIGDSDIKMGMRYIDVAAFDSEQGFIEFSRPLYDNQTGVVETFI